MMRVLVFCTAVCVLNAGVRCLPLLDDKGAGECDTADVSMSINRNGPGTDCTVVESDDVLNTEQRHKALLRELQQLAEQERERKSERGYDRDDYKQNDTVRDEDEEWEEDEEDDDDEDEGVMEKNERDLEELLEMRETQRTADEEKPQQTEEEERSTELELMMEVRKVEKELKQLLEMNDTQTWNREQEKQQKQEELQELLRKMSRVQEEDRRRSDGQTDKREMPQKREMEKASDEATRQFERERERQSEEDEDEELLEIEAELRKVAAELRELRSG